MRRLSKKFPTSSTGNYDTRMDKMKSTAIKLGPLAGLITTAKLSGDQAAPPAE